MAGTALAVVVTATPPTVTLDGDTVTIPVRNYGLTLTIGDRVRVELGSPPVAPLVLQVLS